MAGLEYRYAVLVRNPWPSMAMVLIVLPVNVLITQHLLPIWQLSIALPPYLLLAFLLDRRFPPQLKPRLTISNNGISCSRPGQGWQPALAWSWEDIRQLEYAAWSPRHPQINRILRIQLHNGRQDTLRLSNGRKPLYQALDGAPELETTLASLWGKPIPFAGQGRPEDDLGRYGAHVGLLWIALVVADIIYFVRLQNVGGWLSGNAGLVALGLGALVTGLCWAYMRSEQFRFRVFVGALMLPVASIALWLLLLGTTLAYAPRQADDFTAGDSNDSWQGWRASDGSPIGTPTRHPQPSGSHRHMAVSQGPLGLSALRYDQLP